jgi:hypothetical protein
LASIVLGDLIEDDDILIVVGAALDPALRDVLIRAGAISPRAADHASGQVVAWLDSQWVSAGNANTPHPVESAFDSDLLG